MPPAFNLSQDQTLKFNPIWPNSSSLTCWHSISLLPCSKLQCAFHERPHLSVVQLVKEQLNHFSFRLTAVRFAVCVASRDEIMSKDLISVKRSPKLFSETF